MEEAPTATKRSHPTGEGGLGHRRPSPAGSARSSNETGFWILALCRVNHSHWLRARRNTMKKISILLTFALAACGAGTSDGGNSGTGAVTAQAGAVSGVAVDSQNRPLAGAEIT